MLIWIAYRGRVGDMDVALIRHDANSRTRQGMKGGFCQRCGDGVWDIESVDDSRRAQRHKHGDVFFRDGDCFVATLLAMTANHNAR